MKVWIDPPSVDVPERLQSAVGGHSLVTRTLVQRGFAEPEAALAFLDPCRYQPASPFVMPNMDRATERVGKAIQRGEPITVWGDFDVDGQTSTTLLVSTLQDLGGEARFYIPHRQKESHGVNIPGLERIIADGAGLVLTCDTGVTDHEAIAYALSQGVDVVVTDHHDLPEVLPEASAVVNPKLLPESHPLRELPGVGCAYKLAEGLYQLADRAQDAERHLDLVALGIVADIAVQTGDTRYLLQRGLKALRETERLGLQVMMETVNLDPDQITEEHIGFVLGPRLNALGRLADARVAVELLMTHDRTRARTLVTQVEGLNAQRKQLSEDVMQGALGQIERDPSLLEYAALVLSHPTWPAGVIGIVAGRLAERYHRPVILISAPPDQLGRGSARSVKGIHIHQALIENQDLMVRFGGHPMAAGLAIEPERIPEFRRALSRTIQDMAETVQDPVLRIDGYLSLADLSLDLLDQIRRLAPFGPGNPSLVLVSQDLSISEHRLIGSGEEHRLLMVKDESGTTQKVVWWHGAGNELPEGRFDLAFTLGANEYRGQLEVQVEWLDARVVEAPVTELRSTAPMMTVVDYRQQLNPRELLDRLREEGPVQAWSEAGARAEIDGQDRHGVGPAERLVIWTTPPGPVELQRVLETVAPKIVYLFGIDPELDQPEPFLERLSGLVKHALKNQKGWVVLSTLAAAMAHREATVRAGLDWLVSRGYVTVLIEEEERLQLAAGAKATPEARVEKPMQLQVLLAETQAYRRHFVRMDKENLF